MLFRSGLLRVDPERARATDTTDFEVRRIGGRGDVLGIRAGRRRPEHITPAAYPAHLEVRRVSSAGTFRLHSQQPFLSQVLRGEDIGLEEVGDGIWNIVYYSTLLGKIDERSLDITGTK